MDIIEQAKKHPKNTRGGPYRTAWAKGYVAGQAFASDGTRTDCPYKPRSLFALVWGEGVKQARADAPKKARVCRRPDCPHVLGPNDCICARCGTFQPPHQGR